MQVHERIKTLRENKKLSQCNLAHELGLDQSQYSRREKGEIPFIPNEIIKLSKLLETSVSNLFGEETNPNLKEINFGKNALIQEKLIEQYELRLKEKDDMIVLIKSKIKSKTF